MLPVGGGCHPLTVAGVPVVLTRDGEGTIRALGNVCRHRGAVLCEVPGPARSLRCPYHGWTYGLDGSLRAAPRSDRETDFDAAAHPLGELALGRWGPFLFVSPGNAPPFDDVLADLPDLVARAGIEVDKLRFLRRSTGEYRANWKVCVENFLECYHCRVAHPSFARVIATGPDDYVLDTAPTFSTQYGPVSGGDDGFDPGGPIGRSQFHLLYPGTTINIMPGHPNLSIGPVIPTGPQSTHRYLDYFVGPDVDDEWIEGMLAFDDRVGAEDLALVESVQRGMASGLHEHGTLFVDSEGLIAHFNEYIRRALG